MSVCVTCVSVTVCLLCNSECIVLLTLSSEDRMINLPSLITLMIDGYYTVFCVPIRGFVINIVNDIM